MKVTPFRHHRGFSGETPQILNDHVYWLLALTIHVHGEVQSQNWSIYPIGKLTPPASYETEWYSKWKWVCPRFYFGMMIFPFSGRLWPPGIPFNKSWNKPGINKQLWFKPPLAMVNLQKNTGLGVIKLSHIGSTLKTEWGEWVSRHTYCFDVRQAGCPIHQSGE